MPDEDVLLVWETSLWLDKPEANEGRRKVCVAPLVRARDLEANCHGSASSPSSKQYASKNEEIQRRCGVAVVALPVSTALSTRISPIRARVIREISRGGGGKAGGEWRWHVVNLRNARIIAVYAVRVLAQGIMNVKGGRDLIFLVLMTCASKA